MWREWRRWLGLCSRPYYAMHALTFLSYPLLRLFLVELASPADSASLVKWELQAVLSLFIILMMKYSKSITLELFVADALLYGKGMLALLAFMLDLHILSWYLVFYLITFLLFLQPSFSGLGNVAYFTPLQLENELSNETQLLLVEFGAACSPRCIKATRLLEKLSLRYSKANLQFAKVDIGRFPYAATLYEISFGVMSQGIPTLVLFKGGVEVSRLSQDSLDAAVSTQIFTEATIVEHFELDLLLIRQLSRKLSQGSPLHVLSNI